MIQAEPTWPPPETETVGATTLRVVPHPASRRILILDPGLMDGRGHHLRFNRDLIAEAGKRGYRVGVIGNKAMSEPLKGLRFMPHFRCWTYDKLCDDALSGWLENHMILSQLWAADLAALPVEEGDILLVPTATAPQIQALAIWAKDRGNQIIICNGFSVGFDRLGNVVGMDAVCWRYAFRALNATAANARVVSWFDTDNVRKVAAPMPVIAAPAAQSGIVRDRSGDNPITIGFVGHQRPAKGFGLVPGLVQKLIETFGDRVKIIAHDSSGDNWDDVVSKLLSLGATVIQDAMSGAEYDATLDRLSVLVLPYDPAAYATLMSGAAAEAIACGLPVVVPAGTILADDVKRYGAGGAAFSQWSVDSLHRAVEAAVHSLPFQSGLSLKAAAKWGDANGPAKLFDAMGL